MPETTLLREARPQAPATAAAPSPSPPAHPRPMRWTVDTYVAAIEAGAFPPTLRAELIRGQIIERMPIGDPHAYTVRQLNKLFLRAVGDDWVVGIQDPVQLSDESRPEPDAWIASGPDSKYASRAPAAAELLLLCEVADSSLRFDRTEKLSLYAEADVSEYWILDVRARELERHTDPRPDGTYATKRVFAKAETLQHERLGDVALEGLFSPEPVGDEAPESPPGP